MGIRSQDILSGAFLTLAQMKGASLILLPALQTNESFRRKAIQNIDNKIGIEPFWAGFEAMGKAERIRQLLQFSIKCGNFYLDRD